jgi:flagellar hook protein FlgE
MPSILSGLFSGRSGLSSHGLAISVVGDNISNASTIGYKSSRAEFSDLVSAGQPNGRIIGSGGKIQEVIPKQDQGSLEFTNRTFDVAIEGNGFYVVDSINGSRMYTRAGNFKVDEDGFIVTQSNDFVLGFPTQGTGGLERINVANILQENVVTTNATLNGNLDARGVATPISAGLNSIPTAQAIANNTATPAATDPTYADLNEEAEFSTVVNVYDSLGQEHSVNLYFFKTSNTAPQFTARAYVDSEDIDPNTNFPGRPRLLTNSAQTTTELPLNFNSDGTLVSGSNSSLGLNIPWNNGATEQDVTIDLTNFTQFATSSSVSSITQDGQGVGEVTSINIEPNGEIFAVLSSAQSATIGHIGLASFFNAEGLRRVGENYLQETGQSGEPIIGKPSTGRLGSLQAGALELSTVDIADEFVKLVTLQRAFQANSRIITTVNNLLQDIIQLV